MRDDLEPNARARGRIAKSASSSLDEIIGANPFDVPPSWVSQLVDAYAKAYRSPKARRSGSRREFRPMAERQVRRDLVIDTIAERESLTATEADIDDRIAETAAKRGADPGQLYASLQKAGRLKEIERASPKTRSSSGCWRGTPSNDEHALVAGCSCWWLGDAG